MRLYLIIFFVLFLPVSCYANDRDSAKAIPGSEVITDKQFKKTLLEYLALDEKLDYVKIYEYKSKNYLKRHFPNIKNAEEYKNDMRNTSERSAPKYLEIINWKKVNDSRYEVELIFEGMGEGELLKIKTRYYFIKENGKWKYDGLDIGNYKVIE